MRSAFAVRRAAAVRAIGYQGLEICGMADFGGTNLWLGGPEGLDSSRLAEELKQDGVLMEPGAPFFEHGNPVRYFRLAYSSIPAERIEEGIGIIGSRVAASMRIGSAAPAQEPKG
jgi:GntR family transcriptional regulator/MocR family aminotransferase